MTYANSLRSPDLHKSSWSSKIYTGTIAHRRHVEASHVFKYKLFMLFLDLDELPLLNTKLRFFGYNQRNLMSIHRKDFLPSTPGHDIKEAAISKIYEETGERFEGKIYLLAHPRWFGFVMNPLAVYYCFDSNQDLKHIIGEITNTPWNERHCYVMSPASESLGGRKSHEFNFRKDFHVSPFLPMDMQYKWKFNFPNEHLTINIWNFTGTRLDFEAHLTLEAQKFSVWNLFKNWARNPWITVKVALGIYINAGILYFAKKVTFFSNPKFKTSQTNSINLSKGPL